MDASNLVMPTVFFVARSNLEHSPDGLHGNEETINICTFWLVEAMTHVARHEPKLLDEARLPPSTWTGPWGPGPERVSAIELVLVAPSIPGLGPRQGAGNPQQACLEPTPRGRSRLPSFPLARP